MLEQGDIVLVPVPFTDLTSNRRRPVIVVSNDGYGCNCVSYKSFKNTAFFKISSNADGEKRREFCKL